MNLLKKIILSGLMFFVLFGAVAPSFFVAKAADTSTWYNQSFPEWFGKVYDTSNPSEIFGERYTAAQVQWIIYSLFSYIITTTTGPKNADVVRCFLVGTSGVQTCVDGLQSLLTSNNVPTTTANSNQKQLSLLSLVFASDRPISGISYVKEKLQNFKLVPVAYAQSAGFGFTTALKPIQSIWRSFRDFSFGLFVLVAVVFAFMIMFRVKLSPQTVISVQSALPKIIIALILVTFSYAIAGFLVDLMYVVIGIISIMSAPIVGLSAPHLFNFLTVGQPLGGVQMGILLAGAVYLILFVFFFLALSSMTLLGLTAIVGTTIATALFSVSGIGAIILILLAIIVILMLVWMFIKTLWALVKAFANVLLLTIIAPVQIALGVVMPNLGFGQWVKSFVSNLAIFVITGVLMLGSYFFLFQAIYIGFGNDLLHTVLSLVGFLPGALYDTVVSQGPWPPLLGGGDSAPTIGLLFLGVSFVLFTLIPKATQVVQGFVSGKPFAYGTAIGEAFGAVNWGAGKISRSPTYRTFQEGAGYSTAASLLGYVENKPWGKNLLRATSRFTGISDSTAKDVAANLRAKSEQRKPV